MESAQQYPLPVWAAVVHNVRLVSDHWRVVVRICWAWMLVSGLAVALSKLCLLLGFGPAYVHIKGSNLPAWAWTIILASMFVSAVGLASISVAWHRFVLLDEVPRHRAYLAVNPRVISYVLKSIGLAFIFGLVAGVGMAVGTIAQRLGSPLLGQIAVITGILLATMVVLRFSLVLPATAMSEARVTFAEAWKLTGDHKFRIFVIAWATGLIIVCIELLFALLSIPLGLLGGAGVAIAAFSGALVQIITTIAAVGLFTVMYGVLVEHRRLD